MTYKTFNYGDVFTALDAQTLMDQSVIHVPTTAQLATLPATVGTLAYVESEARYVSHRGGGLWIPLGDSRVIIRPTAVQNGTIHPDGTVTANVAAGAWCVIQNAFPEGFTSFDVEFTLDPGSAAYVLIRTVAGTTMDVTAAGYSNGRFYVTGAGAFSGAHSADNFGFLTPVATAGGIAGTAHVHNPLSITQPTAIKANTTAGSVAQQASVTLAAASLADGFAIQRSAGATAGTIRIYGNI